MSARLVCATRPSCVDRVRPNTSRGCVRSGCALRRPARRPAIDWSRSAHTASRWCQNNRHSRRRRYRSSAPFPGSKNTDKFDGPARRGESIDGRRSAAAPHRYVPQGAGHKTRVPTDMSRRGSLYPDARKLCRGRPIRLRAAASFWHCVESHRSHPALICGPKFLQPDKKFYRALATALLSTLEKACQLFYRYRSVLAPANSASMSRLGRPLAPIHAGQFGMPDTENSTLHTPHHALADALVLAPTSADIACIDLQKKSSATRHHRFRSVRFLADWRYQNRPAPA